MSSKVWKEYIKKHGEAPEDETDLLVFSKKSRKIQTLTLKQALRIYNKHKDDIPQKKRKSKKKGEKKESSASKAKNKSKKKDTNSSKKKKDAKAKKSTRNREPKSQKKRNKDTKSSKKKDRKSSKKEAKNKKQNKAKNLSPSKYKKKAAKRRRTSTDEHIKRRKREEEKKMDEALLEHKVTDNINDDMTTNDDNKINNEDIDDVTANDNNEDDDIKHNDIDDKAVNIDTNNINNNEKNANTDTIRIEAQQNEVISLDPDINHDKEDADENNADIYNNGISHKSPAMSSALAMFQNMSSPKGDSQNLLASSKPVKKVTKKGKRYFDFREFASGAFSIVYKAKDKENEDRIVAVKKIHIGGSLVDGNFEATTKEEGDNEVRILKLVNDHKNTCNMLDTYFDMKLGVNSGYVLCIAMQYMQCTLKERIEFYGEEGDCLPFNLIKIYTFQIFKAVNYMHIKNVCHRDIKPENILVNAKTNEIQLCDFGCSLVLGVNEYNNDEEYKYEKKEDGYEPYVMSRFYRAPECILGNRYYDCSADIWSLGVVFGEMYLGMILFMGSSNKDQLREIIMKLGWPTKQQLLDMNPNIDKFDAIDGVYGLNKDNAFGESWSMIFCGVFDIEEAAIELISELLVYSPKQRIPLVECLEHDYFDEVESLMKKSNKKKNGKKKMKKEDYVPSHLFDWNEKEIQYAKSEDVDLPTYSD